MGKRIIIIGATSGIGRKVAEVYITQGWKVGVAGRRAEEAGIRLHVRRAVLLSGIHAGRQGLPRHLRPIHDRLLAQNGARGSPPHSGGHLDRLQQNARVESLHLRQR